MIKKISLFIVSIIIIGTFKIHQSIKIDGFKARRLNIKTKNVQVYMCDSRGKLHVKYNGNLSKILIIIEKNDGNSGDNSNYYIINKNETEVIGLTYGTGEYDIKICNINNTDIEIKEKYRVYINIEDKLAPFKGISYHSKNNLKVNEVTKKIQEKNTANFIMDTYQYVTNNILYNDELASLVSNGGISLHKPNVEKILMSRRGICIDYAALMVNILRLKGIPTKVVMGYNSKNQYHAWVEVFQSGSWLMYDPTLKIIYTDKESLSYEPLKYY